MSNALHKGTFSKGAVKYISASAAPQMCPMAQSRQRLPRRLPRRSHIAFSPKKCARHTLRASTAPPAGEIYSPTPSYDAPSSFLTETFLVKLRQIAELRAGACIPPGGSAATARRARACVSAASVHYVGTPRQAASQHRRDAQHRPHFAELPKPEYTPPPRSDVN